ncbi:Gfo/Idh/MocA family protein [Arachidicoccus sp.]|uniref:Gfo/Idh/MocA family protein n=1 Tax=Arachidicoccus sp. TaxID=1872624 RepID=UPI003D194FDC
MQIIDQALMPKTKIPVIIIGASSIVKDAQLPAYKKGGFEVFGILNRTRSKAEELAEEFEIPRVFNNLKEAIAAAPEKVIYDIAIMPQQYIDILNELPDESIVLIQKPMGENLEEAKLILQTCKEKKHIAAINFQLRHAPFIIAARELIKGGLIGEIYDFEVRLTTFTPWGIFPIIALNKRLEILYHSIHYMDLIRSFLGNPNTVVSKTFGHPLKSYSSTRTTTVFDYGENTRAVINTNHDHHFGAKNQESFIKIEGTKGAIKIKMGLLLDYPLGAADKFEYCLLEENKEPKWVEYKIEGSWFPEAFTNIMAGLMRFAEGSDVTLPTRVEDVIHTMEVVESAYLSNEIDGQLLKA